MISQQQSSTAVPTRRQWSRLSQTHWIFISMIAGAALGYCFPDGPHAGPFRASDLEVLSTLFLRMIKLILAPIIFSTLVVGIAGHGDDMKRVGKLALRSIVYFEIVTTLALIVGLTVANIVKPGVGVHLDPAAPAAATDASAAPISLSHILEHVVPQSIFDAAARNDALQIVFFSILFAVALAQVTGPAKWVVLTFCESLSEVMFTLVGFVMKVAPFGIGGAIAATVAKSGLGVLGKLGVLVLTLYGSLIVFALFVLLPIAILAGVPIRRFLHAVKTPWLVAFTTASSEAALPLAFQNVEKLGVPRHIAAFVLPTGYSFNMDGTALYLTLASMFVAQAAGIDLSLRQQAFMMLTLMLTSKGAAAVPRSSLVILSATAVQFGLPLQGVALILGVDALMDMARTSLNVLGNCLASVLMARWDGSFVLRAEAGVDVEDLPSSTITTFPPLEGVTV
jgi:Na+/H+-dicarboxylate symporter